MTHQYHSETPQTSAREHGRIFFAAAWLLAFATPWDDMIILPGEIQLTRVLSLLVGALWIVSAAQRGRMRSPMRIHLFMAAFLAWSVLTYFWSVDPERTARRSLSYLQLMILAWVIYQSAESLSRYRSLLQACLLGNTVLVGFVFKAYIEGQLWGEGRYTANGVNPNDLAGSLAVGIPMAWWLLTTGSRAWWAVFNWLYMLAAASAIVLTGSRTGLLALIVAAIYPSIRLLKASWKVRFAALVLIAGGGFVLLEVSDTIAARRILTVLSQFEQRDFGGRASAWQLGYQVFQESPLLGLGAGTFSVATSSIYHIPIAAHNMFIEVAVESGGVGVAFFLMIVASAFSSRSPNPGFRRHLLFILLTWAAVGMASSWENKTITWLLLGLATHCPKTGTSRFALASIRPHRVGAWRTA
ncbi:MAG: O-antigen ligase family protein [Acidobacteria bacterium]|nr:O-antigen ligase family protein [Acidobacteriota bacterium]